MSRQSMFSALTWMTTFVVVAAAMCENTLPNEPPMRPDPSGRERVWHADRWLPQRIKAAARPCSSYPPHTNLRDYFFWEPGSTEDHRISLDDLDGYYTDYGSLELYTLFPAIGGLYCFDGFESSRISAHLVPLEQMPSGVKLGKDEDVYVFISFPRTPHRQTGALDHHRVCIGPIEKEEGEEEDRYTVKLVVDERRGPQAPREWPRKPDGTIDWRVMRVGDVLPVTEDRQYRLLNIVPPDNEGRVIRWDEHTQFKCKMLGWIEFTRRPIPLPPKAERTDE